MKYLGVPLISTRLSHCDCQPLLDKILARIHAWTSRSLSFAGRLCSCYLQCCITFKCTGAVCSSFQNTLLLKLSKFSAAFYGLVKWGMLVVLR